MGEHCFRRHRPPLSQNLNRLLVTSSNDPLTGMDDRRSRGIITALANHGQPASGSCNNRVSETCRIVNDPFEERFSERQDIFLRPLLRGDILMWRTEGDT
jgi:hypothetical protein